MAYDPENIFAKIIKGEMPSHKVYEDDETFAFLDIMPRSKGHTLVIPKAGAENIEDIRAEDFAAMMQTVHKLAPAVKRAVGADGVMLQQLNGPAAGQIVFHIHFHIVPRFDDVPLKHHGATEVQHDLLAANAERIRAEVAKL